MTYPLAGNRPQLFVTWKTINVYKNKKEVSSQRNVNEIVYAGFLRKQSNESVLVTRFLSI